MLATLGCTGLLFAGCVTGRSARMESSAARLPPAQRTASVLPEPAAKVNTKALRNALVDFEFSGQDARHGMAPGGRMTPQQARHWVKMLASVDSYLSGDASEVTVEALSQTRAILETELGRDAAVYGDFPPLLADSITEHEAQLAVRAIQLHPPEWKRDPKLKFEWPVEPVRVTSLFGRRFHPIERRFKSHEGLDLAAEPGQLVCAAGPGRVHRAGWFGNYGFQVEVVHGGGLITRYSHLLQPLVEVGDAVDGGDVLGLAGSTGASTGPHLHFEVWRKGRAMDPLREMRFVRGMVPEVLVSRQARMQPLKRRPDKPLRAEKSVEPRAVPTPLASAL